MAIQRGGFSSRLGFILAAAGSAVGLGNIWKFPFEVGQGGGFVLCFPVMVAEIAIGRKTQKNPVGAFKGLGYKSWSIIGYLGLASGVLILSFYNVVAAWAFGYFIEMLWGNFTIGPLFIMILALIIYALTLPNAMDGVKFYLIPEFDKITGSVVYNALGQAFFSLSLGMGALITYGSYLSKKENIVSSAAAITLMDVSVAVLAGLMIFPFVFSQGIETSGGPGLIFITLPGIFQSLGDVLGVIVGSFFFLLLSFAAFTSTISLLEVPTAYVIDEHKVKRSKATWIIAIIIFIVGIPSMLSQGAVDWLSKFVTLPGAGEQSFLDFVALLSSDTFLPLGGFLITLFTAYVWRKENFNQELAQGADGIKGSWLQAYVNFAVSYICPLILGAIFIVTVLDNFFGIKLI